MTSPLSLSLVPGDVSSGIWLCKFLRAEMWGPAGYLPTLVHGSDSWRVCVCVCVRACTRACVRSGRVTGTNTFAKTPQVFARFVCAKAWRDKCDLPDRRKLTRFAHFTVAGGGRINFRVNVESHEYVSGAPGQCSRRVSG